MHGLSPLGWLRARRAALELHEFAGVSEGRTRRRFLGVPLLVIALAALALTSGAQAVHDDGLFELDRNATDQAAPGDDWDLICKSHQPPAGTCVFAPGYPVPAGSASADASLFVHDGIGPTIFTGGGSKDDLDTTNWRHTTGNVPDKDELLNVFVARYGDTVYFGADRYAGNGSAQMGIWFLQEQVAPRPNGTFGPGKHRNGDILVLSEFTNGGSNTTIRVFQWESPGGPINGTLRQIAGSADTPADCLGPPAVDPGDAFCATVNRDDVPSPWVFEPKFGVAGIIPPGQLYEGGLDLAAFPGLAEECFSSVIIETRSSPSIDAVLKDFAGGTFERCDATLTTTPSDAQGNPVAAIERGGSVRDHALVEGLGTTAAPTGTVTFYICSPGQLTNGVCASGGTLVSTNSLAPIAGTTDSETISGAFVPTSTGKWCWRGEYSGDGNYPAATDSSEGECLLVVDARVSVSPLNATNEVGDTHTITATVLADDGTLAPFEGATVQFSLLNNAAGATFVGGVDSCVTNEDGQCSIQITASSAGGVDIRATTTIEVEGVSLTRTTGSGGNNSADAHKAFVDANVSIAPSGVNEVGDAHTFTITTTALPAGTTPTLVSITPNVSPVPSLLSSTCNSPSVSGNTATCTVTINSSSAGTFTANATAEWSFSGLAGTVTRSTSANSGPGGSGPATKDYVDANVSIAPSGVNEVGDPHTFTITTTAFPAGTTASLVSIAPGVSPAADSMSSTCATPDVSGNTATCTVTINSSSAGTFTANATAEWSFGGLAGTVTRSTAANSGAGGSGPATKRFVDARIAITPQEAVNPVGSPHVFTAHVTVDDGTGAGFVSAPDGTEVTFAIDSGPGSFTTANPCTTSGGTGTCTITLVSNVPGTTVVSASTVLTVDGVELTRTTDGQAGNSGPASKEWVAARISIAPDATNEIGDPHTFTVTVERSDGGDWEPVAGVTVAVTLTDSNGATQTTSEDTCAGPGTDADGRCTVTFTSPTAGKVTGHASADVPVNGSSAHVETDGQGDNSGDAVKTFVDARIAITPSQAANQVGDAHTFTGHVLVDRGDGNGFVNAPDGTAITFAKVDGPGTLGTPNPCTTAGGTGACTITLVSATPGVTTVGASTSVTIAGVTLARTTNGQAGSSGPAVKRWVDARISIGPSGVNEIGDAHAFTVLVEQNDGSGWSAASGVEITSATSFGTITGGTCGPSGTTDAQGECTVTVNSGAAGTALVNASGTVTVEGIDIDVATDGYGAHEIDNSKAWVDANIQITPQQAVNPIGSPHVFTARVNVNRGDGAGFVPAPDGTQVTFTKVSGLGDFTTPAACTTAGGTGMCTATLVSNTPGTTVVGASATVTVGGVELTRTTNGQAGNSGPASKQWVATRILIAPDAVNPVGQPHTFTVTVQRDTGGGFTGVAGVHVDVTLTNSNGAAHTAPTGTCTNAGANTNANGQCTVTFTSPTGGLVTARASANVPINGTTVLVQTNGTGGSSGPAVKRFVDARIALTPLTAVNPVNTDHVFTATVTVNAGDGAGFVPAANGTQVAFTLVSGPGSFTTPTTCATVAGTCTVTLRSAVAGTSVVSASTTVSVQGVALARSTNGQAGNSGTAEKQWTVFTPPATCQSLTATPRTLQAGRRTTIVARVRLSNGRPMARTRVRVTAPGINVTRRTNAQGVVRIPVRPTRAGIARIQVVGSAQCQTRRGVIGVFRPPPLTG